MTPEIRQHLLAAIQHIYAAQALVTDSPDLYRLFDDARYGIEDALEGGQP